MRKIKNIPVLILLSLFAVSAYAGIIYNGNEYTEKDMPFFIDGSGIQYFVVSGSIDNVNSWNMRSLTINGASFTNIWSSTMPAAVDGNKYFIIYNPKNKFAHFEIAGTNDWGSGTTTIDTTEIDIPFTYDGQARIYFSTAGTINTISSWSLDTLLINGVDYTNSWSDVMPERINGMYYIYYRSDLDFGHLEIGGNNTVPLPEADTLSINLPYSFDGVGHHVFMTMDNIESISSWETDSVNVNGMVITNQTRSDIPVLPDGKYYIYYKGTQGGSHLEIAKYEPYPDVVSYNGQDYNKVTMPFTASGSTPQYVYVYGSVDNFYSSGVSTLEINGVNYTNQSSTTMPASVDGKYFIKYIPKNRNSYFEINGSGIEPVFILNIKIFLESAIISGAH
jgi:Carbohydrate-binding module 64